MAARPTEDMSEDRWRGVIALNKAINRQMRERDDYRVYGVADFWTIGGRYGDCEDFVITKKKALISRGFAPENLLYAVSRNRWDSGYHAVLILRTTDGDYVLDNLRDRILPWEEAGLDFRMRMSSEEPSAWVAVANRGVEPGQRLSRLD